MFWWQPGDSWQLVSSMVSFVYGVGLAHCLGKNYFGKPNPILRSFCFWQCFDVSVWNRHDVKGRPRLGKEGWIVTKSGFAVSLFFKSQFWLWREEAAEQDYLVLSPENPLEMEFKSVAKLFNNNFKRSSTCNSLELPVLIHYQQTQFPMSLWIH